MSTPSESSTRNLLWTCFQFVYSSLIICINHAFVNIPVWKRGLVSQAGGCTLPTAVCNCNVLLPDILATRQILTHGFGNTAPTRSYHMHIWLYIGLPPCLADFSDKGKNGERTEDVMWSICTLECRREDLKERKERKTERPCIPDITSLKYALHLSRDSCHRYTLWIK